MTPSLFLLEGVTITPHATGEPVTYTARELTLDFKYSPDDPGWLGRDFYMSSGPRFLHMIVTCTAPLPPEGSRIDVLAKGTDGTTGRIRLYDVREATEEELFKYEYPPGTMLTRAAGPDGDHAFLSPSPGDIPEEYDYRVTL